MQLQTKKVIKAIIHVIRERVPERYFDKFLGLAYAIYKAAVRFLYLAKGAWSHGRHDREKWEMVRIIYAMLPRSEEHTSELQSHSFISYAVFCLKKKKQ